MTPLRIVVLLACLAAAPAIAAPASARSTVPVDALREQFPAASIDSVAKADEALAATAGAKARADKDYKAATTACLKKVLVNSCLDEARALQRKRAGDIEAVEIEANRFKRRDKADRVEADRAKREAERSAKAPSDAAQRERNRKAYDDKQVEATRAADDQARRTASAARAHRPPPKPATPATVDAAQREKNAVAFAAHQKAAAEHEVDMERRLAEKTVDRKRRADAKAAKDAKTAALAGAPAALPSVAGPKP